MRDSLFPCDGEYMAPNGDLIPFFRCDGGVVCAHCKKQYRDHPSDPREPCLTVLCRTEIRAKL